MRKNAKNRVFRGPPFLTPFGAKNGSSLQTSISHVYFTWSSQSFPNFVHFHPCSLDSLELKAVFQTPKKGSPKKDPFSASAPNPSLELLVLKTRTLVLASAPILVIQPTLVGTKECSDPVWALFGPNSASLSSIPLRAHPELRFSLDLKFVEL